MKVKLVCKECGKEYLVKPSQAHRSKFCCHHCHIVSNNKNRTCDLTGKRFVRWTVISQEPSDDHGTRWLCHCDCGNEKIVGSNSLISGDSKSCGCYFDDTNRERAKTTFRKHGQSGTPQYVCYHARLRRERRKLLDFGWTLEMNQLLLSLQTSCAICGASSHLVVDHVKPLSKGNGLYPGNAIVLCHSCNSKKQSRDLTELPREWQDKIERAASQFLSAWNSL